MVSDPSFPTYEKLHEVKHYLIQTKITNLTFITTCYLKLQKVCYFAFVPNGILFIMTLDSHLREVVKW